MAKSLLKIQCFKNNSYYPVDKSKITITPRGEEVNANKGEINIFTDSSGKTEQIELDAPSFQNFQ